MIKAIQYYINVFLIQTFSPVRDELFLDFGQR